MRAAGGRAETACMRNLPYLPRIAAVVANGRYLSRADLDGILAKAEAYARSH